MNDNPAGEVRPMIHRKPPNDTATWSASPQIAAVGILTGGSRPSDACLLRPTDALNGVRELANGESRLN
jgi:hypothetical protein